MLRIYLLGVKPPVWREVSVPAQLTLAAFHDKVLCPLFGYKRNDRFYMAFAALSSQHSAV